jgi:hypothetical protein
MSDHDMIRRGDAYGEFPDDWRDRAHGFKGTFKMQAAWSDGFNACRKSIAALPAVDPLADPRVTALAEALADVYRLHMRRGPAWDHEPTKKVMDRAAAALAAFKGGEA